ncbi:MAG: DoxX family protein [Verrucomicrobiota bacterium]|nr:DoxX family protein [Verrucomicrobiota bacterium]
MMSELRAFFNKPDFGLLFLRVCLGLMMIAAGMPKFLGGRGMLESVGGAMKTVYGLDLLPAVAWGFIAASAEVFGGSLIVLGLVFRPAVFGLAFTMFTAFMLTFKSAGSGLEHMDKYGFALSLCVVFISLLFIGPGKYAVDKGAGGSSSGGGGGKKRSSSSE